MKKKQKFDFGGYVTKYNVKCSDGRTIKHGAFSDCDGKKVPLLWAHFHQEPTSVLGHVTLEHRDDGVYGYASLNGTEAGKHTKEMIEHGDITAMSIYANNLNEKNKNVQHGEIKEVSLVLAGANAGAFIDNLAFQHDDGTEEIDLEEAIMYNTALTLTHGDEDDEKDDEDDDEDLEHAEEGATIADVIDTMNEDQKNVMYYLVGQAAEESGSDDSDGEATHSEGGKGKMKKNVFDKGTDKDNELMHGQKPRLSAEQIKTIVDSAKQCGSFKEAFLMHADEWGIGNIEYLFPDARNPEGAAPQTITRDMGWVQPFLSGTRHTPFSRIKTIVADLTEDEARARGYITGNRKKEQFFELAKRATTPQTVYKKQKLDRDDIVDITDLDIVAWLKAEMRLLLNEELARAGLIGDGRDPSSEDKINEQNIRPVWKDDDLFTIKYPVDKDITTAKFIDEVVRARKGYRGTGRPNLYVYEDVLTEMMLVQDLNQRRIYKTEDELASALRVREIVSVEVMDPAAIGVRSDSADIDWKLKAIILNPADYTFGADRGGAVNMFDDFDIDYNQYKYLIETRCSGCLTKPFSAVAIEYTEEDITP